MVGELVTLPVRVGVRVTRLWFRALEEGVSVAASATERAVGLVASRGANGGATAEAVPRDEIWREEEPAREREERGGTPRDRAVREREERAVREREERTHARDEPARDQRPPAEPPAARPSGPEPRATERGGAPAAEPVAEPVHVSEEPVLVEELAEPGAEDGAGAELRVDPPWDGYQQLSAKQVIARLSEADQAELAAVQLYESTHRRRQTVINAVDREMRNAAHTTNKEDHQKG